MPHGAPISASSSRLAAGKRLIVLALLIRQVYKVHVHAAGWAKRLLKARTASTARPSHITGHRRIRRRATVSPRRSASCPARVTPAFPSPRRPPRRSFSDAAAPAPTMLPRSFMPETVCAVPRRRSRCCPCSCTGRSARSLPVRLSAQARLPARTYGWENQPSPPPLVGARAQLCPDATHSHRGGQLERFSRCILSIPASSLAFMPSSQKATWFT